MKNVLKWLFGLLLLPLLFYLMIAYQLVLADFRVNHLFVTSFDWFVIYNMILLAVLIYLGLFIYLNRGRQWEKLSKSILGLVLLIGLPALFVSNALGFFILRLEGKLFPVNQLALRQMLDTLPLSFVFLMVIFIAPFLEEFFFRFFLPALLFPKNPNIGLWLGAIVFGFFHRPTNLGSLVIYLGMGLVFAGIAQKTGRLAYSLILHIVYNLLVFVGMLLA